MNELVESTFGGSRGEVADTAGSKQTQTRELAETQAKVLMAKRFPRDVVANTDKILNAFTRPTLAEKAQYQFARGGTDISGPSIRAAEAIAQQWGNIEFGFREISRGIAADGVPFSEVEAFAWDMEANSRKPLQFIVRHWRDTKSGGYKLKDERDIYELMANQAQRRTRACILALIPGDVVDAAMAQADVTLSAKADTSQEAMAKMLEAFAAFGVTKEHIEKRIQRRLEAIQPAQVVTLKKIYASLRDEMSKPSEWFDIPDESQPAGDPAVPKGRKTTSVSDIKNKAAAAKPKVDLETGEIIGVDPSALGEYLSAIDIASSADSAALTLDEARSVFGADSAQMKQLSEKYRAKWGGK
jgi:hypothetical protein